MNNKITRLATPLLGGLLMFGPTCPFSQVHAFGQVAKSFVNGSSDVPEERNPATASSTITPHLTQETQGDILMATRRYVEAINCYRLAPDNSAVIMNKIGVAYHHMFSFAEAKKYYEKALKLNPKYSEALNNLGTIYYEEKNYGRSEKLYKRALKIAPHAAVTYSNLGTAYFAHKKYTQGAEAYQKAFSLDPQIFDRDSMGKIEHQGPPGQRATVSYYLAKTYAQAGNSEKALEYLRKAIDNGFNDRKKVMGDKEFSDLRKTPAFRKLLIDENLDWLS